MSQLHDRFDDLVADAPTNVVPDARAAWAAGARRRTRQRVAVVAAAAVVVAVVAGVVTWLPRTIDPAPADPDSTGVEGYPARVLKPWLSRALPDAPGPMAMVYQRNGEDTYGWWVADARGRTWEVPQRDMIDSYPPALSADGRMIGYLADPTTFVIRDLVSGAETSFDSITDGADVREGQGQWWLGSQNPAWWSPDGSHVLVRASGWERNSRTEALVLGVDGTVSELETAGFPAGWTDDDTLAFVQERAEEDGVPPVELRLVGTDGRVEDRATLDVPRAAAAWLNQWSSSVSPDGRALAVVADMGTVYVLSTDDGSRASRTRATTSDTCVASWWGPMPLVFSTDALVAPPEELAIIDFDERLDAVCAIATSDALSGTKQVGLAQRWFGDGWLAFHVGEAVAIAIALGACVLAGVTLLVVRRSRRTRVHHLG